MKIRGERECQACGTRWTYYETGNVSCPSCGSLRSVGVDERTEHTAAPVEFDLTSVRGTVDERPMTEVATDAAEVAGEFVRQYGFVDAGELQPLATEFVAAQELLAVAREVKRTLHLSEDEELYFLDLLDGADEGDRPNPMAVPESLTPARGLAVAATIEAYHRGVTRAEDDLDGTVRTLLGRLRDHRKRIEALDGDIHPREAERFLDATREVGRYLTTGEQAVLAMAESRLDAVQ